MFQSRVNYEAMKPLRHSAGVNGQGISPP